MSAFCSSLGVKGDQMATRSTLSGIPIRLMAVEAETGFQPSNQPKASEWSEAL